VQVPSATSRPDPLHAPGLEDPNIDYPAKQSGLAGCLLSGEDPRRYGPCPAKDALSVRRAASDGRLSVEWRCARYYSALAAVQDTGQRFDFGLPAFRICTLGQTEAGRPSQLFQQR
jgi:hypothetical protein